MSNWLLMTYRGDKHRILARLDAIQFVREGYDNHASIAFEGDEGFVGVEESFDDVYETIKSLWRTDERIYEVAKESENEEA